MVPLVMESKRKVTESRKTVKIIHWIVNNEDCRFVPFWFSDM